MPGKLQKLVASIAVGTVFSGLLYTNSNATTVANSYVENTDHTVQAYILSPLDLWLNRLVRVESGGKAKIKVLDVNDKFSYGCLQFQMYTFKTYGQKYGLIPTDIQSEELEQSIYDCRLQKRIARAMILDNSSNWKHWYNSVVNSTGHPPKTVSEPVELTKK